MSEDIDYQIEAKYKVIEKIGSGAYGHVFKVINRKTKKVKALKKNFDAFHNSTDAQRTYRQIMFLVELHHPNIIQIDQVFIGQNGKDLYIVFEYMDADLHYVIRKKIMTEKHIKYIAYQVANALLYMHSAELIHRDIKPSNILLNDSCQAKLCDFGLVRSIDHVNEEQFDILTQYIATRWYRAPQVILGSRNYSSKIDVWSFGCTLAQIVKGKPLFPGTSTLNQLQRILKWTGLPTQSDIKSLKINQASNTRSKKANSSEYFKQIDPQCLDLIQKCLEFNPEKRIQFEQIVKHPYLSQFYCKSDILRSKNKINIRVDDNSRMNLKIYRSLIIYKANDQLEILAMQIIRPSQKKIFRVRQAKKQMKTQPDTQLQYNEFRKQFLKNSLNEQKSLTVSFKYPSIPRKHSFLLQKSSLNDEKLDNIEVVGFNNSNIIKHQIREKNEEKSMMTKKRNAMSKLTHQEQSLRYNQTSKLKIHSKKKYLVKKEQRSAIQEKVTKI